VKENAMRTLLQFLMVLTALVAYPSPSMTQTSTGNSQPPKSTDVSEDESSDETSKRDLFFDSEDGKLDFSAFLATATGFLPVASLITEPAVGYGGTFGLMFLHDSITGRAEAVATRNPDGTLKRLPPPSITWVGGFATQNGSWGAGLAHLGIFKEDTTATLEVSSTTG
jgi:hypothetical protein